MRNQLAGAIVFLWAGAACAQNPAVAGFVYSDIGPSGIYGYQAVAGVHVRVEGGGQSTVTDEKGFYQFDKLPAGSYQLSLQKEGYLPATKPVEVKKDGTTLNVSLHQAGVASGRGTVYIAYAKRQAAIGVSHNLMAPSMADPRAAVAAGADPLSLAGNLALPQSGKPEESNPTTEDENHLMMLPPAHPTRATFTKLPTMPVWLCFDGTGSRLYVSSRAQMLMVFDALHGNSLLSQIPTPGAVTEMALAQDGRQLLVGVMGTTSGVLLVDTATNQPGAFIAAPSAPRAVVMRGKSLFVCCGDAASGEVRMLENGASRAVKVGQQPTGLALSPDGRLLFCVNSGGASVSVVDTASLREVTRIPVGVNPQKVAVSPDGSRAFVTNKGGDTVSVIDARSLVNLATVPVQAGPIGITFDRKGEKAYVACKDAGCIVVLDGKTGQALQTTTVMPNSSPWGVAVRP